MHLSLLSNATFSDFLDDSGFRLQTRRSVAGRQHLDGVLRGLVFAAALIAPFALTFAFGASPDAPVYTEMRR